MPVILLPLECEKILVGSTFYFFQTAYAADTPVNDELLPASSPSQIDLASHDPDVPAGSTKTSLTDSITYSILESANSDKFLVSF